MRVGPGGDRVGITRKIPSRPGTPLGAASSGHDRVLQMRLEQKDIDTDKADKSRRTPMPWGAG